MDDSRKQKDDSPASLPAGLVRRSLPDRGGLPGVAVAAGLALLLSACGGGGAGAPNSGAGPGGSALSILADAAVAPAPVAEVTPPPNPQAEAPQTQKAPPDAKIIPPRIQESQEPRTARNIVTNPSTIPFPSGSSTTDETVNMNTFGTWGHPDYQPGGSSAAKNNGPNVVVRRRVRRSGKTLTLPVSGGTGNFAYTSLDYGTVVLANLWLTYPAGAGDGDLAVHIRTRRTMATPGGNHKAWVMDWLEAAARLGPYHGFSVEDFFLTEAYLQAPGSAVQPAPQGSETSATWTGKVIAFDSAAKSYLIRGHEIGGDATVTVNFGAGPTVDVSLTDLRSARGLDFQRVESNGGFSPSRYPNQRWTGLVLSGGGFSDSSGGRTIEGVFRNQVMSTGTNANTVGGIFDVTGMMKGGFVASFAPPSPF
ncbi:MAG: hypothetical protein J4F48_04615 [Nitrospinae bacterium]|nr:hypothetical protein [Nitrospinota bacterium]